MSVPAEVIIGALAIIVVGLLIAVVVLTNLVREYERWNRDSRRRAEPMPAKLAPSDGTGRRFGW